MMTSVTLIDTSGLVWALAGDRDAERHAPVTAEHLIDAVRARGLTPAHCVFVLDGAQYRRSAGHVDPVYKAQRAARPAVVQTALDDLPARLAALGLRVFHDPAVEADDAIIAMSHWFGARGVSVRVLSTDRDLMQALNNEHDVWIDLRAWLGDPAAARQVATALADFVPDHDRNARIDVPALPRMVITRGMAQRLWRLPPARIPDVLALTGDRCDHLAGVPGLGRTAASRLLQRYGSLRGVLDEARLRVGPTARGQTPARGVARSSRRMERASRRHNERLISVLQAERDVRRNRALLGHRLHQRSVRQWCDRVLGAADEWHAEAHPVRANSLA